MDRRKQQSARKTTDGRPAVIFIPGGVTPVAISYSDVLEQVKDEVHPALKELEVYAYDAPPEDYGLEMEVDGIERFADDAGLDSFHLVGYSGGGAASLAFTARHPDRVRSLALIEPAWIGNQDWSADETAYWKEINRIMAMLKGEQRLSAFLRLNTGAGQPLPPPAGPAPEWMAKRPAGLDAMTRAFRGYDLDVTALRRFRKPVYIAVGSLSHPAEKRKAERLAKLFPDVKVDVYQGLHHINPPHRAGARRFVAALRELWARGEAAARVEEKAAA